MDSEFQIADPPSAPDAVASAQIAPLPDHVRAAAMAPLVGKLVVEVPLTDIDPLDRTFQFRVLAPTTQLADSLRRTGQQIPVVLRKQPGAGEFQIICGFRRVHALFEIGALSAQAFVLDDVDEKAAVLLAVAENEARRSLTDLDRAHAILRLKRDGYTMPEISDRLFGLSRKHMQRLCRLAEIPECARAALESGAVSTTEIITLAQLVRQHGADVLCFEGWLQRVIDEELSVRGLILAVKKHVAALHESEPNIQGAAAALPGLDACRSQIAAMLEATSPDLRASVIAELRGIVEHLADNSLGSRTNLLNSSTL